MDKQRLVLLEMIRLYLDATEIVICAVVFGFIGLYVGSMRRPSAKTKE